MNKFLLFALFIATLHRISTSVLPNEEPSDEVLTLLEQVYEAHNELREKHGVPPLMINPELVDLAQQEAEKYAKTGEMTDVLVKYRNHSVGQNFAFSQGLILKGRSEK